MANIPVNANDASITVDVTTNGRVTFAYDFRADNIGDLWAIYRETGQSDRFLLGGVNFTATGLGTANGGNITLTTFTATKAGAKLTIYRDTTIKRLTDFTRDLFADNINLEMDQIFMILQELRRGIRDSVGTTPGGEIPDLSDVLAKLSQFPTIGPGDAQKALVVRPDLLGYYLAFIGGGGGGGGGGGIAGYFSLAAAAGATIDADVAVLAVVHSGQILFYRRYLAGGVPEDFAPLTTNGGSVFWAPEGAGSPLHWGAAGDGETNDRIPIQNMLRFYHTTPAVNDEMPAAFENQRPFVIEGHNRTFAIAAPIIMGNPGTAVDTGMIYNLHIRDMRLRAIPGDWESEMVENVPKAMIIAAWNFPNAYSDQFSGIYDVLLDHVTFDMGFLTGAVWVCNTYQFVMNQCRFQHPGVNKIVVDTSPRSSAVGTLPFGYDTGNGAFTLIGPNIEGRVGESGSDYPGGNDIISMGTTGIRLRTNDFRVDAPIISGVSMAIDISGRAGQIYNLHPWSREVRLRPQSHNVMFCNGYLDYTKFVLESFGHTFVGMHWIIPTDPGLDRGVELRASVAATTGEGALFVGCTFGGESLDVRYTTTGAGSWVGEKARKVSFIGCRYGAGNTMLQVERFEDKHGFTPASGAHWFRTGDPTIGENRLVGDTLYIGKDKTVAGSSSLQLQSQAGDQTSLGLYSYAAGGAGLLNFFTGGFIEIAPNAIPGALFIHGTTGNVNVKRKFVAENAAGDTNAIEASTGDIRSILGGLATSSKSVMAITDTVPGFRATGSQASIVNVSAPTTSAPLGLGRQEAGFLIRGACAGSVSSGAGISINSSGVFAFVTSSDERLKEDFKPIDPALIDRFGVYDFAWISTGDRAMGVKAQELREVLPGLVHGSGIVDKPEGAPDDWEPEHFGVDYAQLMPLLIATVKDLRKRVADLENK